MLIYNVNMDNFKFILTDDGSAGLYDEQTKDILHSRTGAKKESYDKFIAPTQYEQYCSTHESVKVLDICFGIGYNCKSAIYYALKNNSDIKIYITSLEINKELTFLSPFIKDGFMTPDINLYLMSHFIINEENFWGYICQFFDNNSQTDLSFFEPNICLVFKNYLKSGGIYRSVHELYAFLHNIYYQNISNSMENLLNPTECLKIDFEIKYGDARQTVTDTKMQYDFVFLDAYTPHKQPLLWTYDFLNAVKSKMRPTSFLATYSNAVPVRKALCDLEFNVGKIILDNLQFGTVATPDKNIKLFPFSDFDKGLMETRAGVPYRDEKFNLTSKEILQKREKELLSCGKISATEYKKRYEHDSNI